MAVIRILERTASDADEGLGITLNIDGADFKASVKPPLDIADELKLEWYFEEWLRYPFFEQRAKEAAASIKA
jgi:hypothetical protein